jgi:multisubunit Na+/H+ antiporter MnhB subunit
MNQALNLSFDAVLAVILVWVAWRLLASNDLFKSVVLFIAFGLLLALAWVRLDAPDVALAEAAIGAGVTGALLLIALARIAEIGPAPGTSGRSVPAPQPATPRPVLIGLLAILVALLSWSLLTLPVGNGLQPLVTEHIADSGVDHAVTAVLLNFRAWDTLLELAVLLISVLGVWSMRRHTPLPVRSVPGPVMPGMVRLLLPVTLITAIYLLWAGSHAPGGAFQAGAVLGAAGVLWVLARPRDLPEPAPALLRLGVAAGVALFIAVGSAGLLAGHGFMGYPPALAGLLILLIELAATLSIALTLVALFLGGAPAGETSTGGQR